MDLISVIVPIYNAADSLERCIDSIMKQNYSNIEIILIDDCSTDKSLEICKKFSKMDKRINITKNENNMGVSQTRNKGIDISKGDYICFVDSDDYINDNYVEILYNNIKKYNVDLACSLIEKVKMNNPILYKNDNKFLGLFTSYKGYIANKLYKIEIIRRNNVRFNENISMCEDLLFNFQYIKQCKNIFCDIYRTYNYQDNHNGLSKSIGMKWFDIIKVYDYIYKNIINYDNETETWLNFNFLIAICEAKMRFRIMKKLNYNLEEEKIHLPDKKKSDDMYRKLIYSTYLTLKDKIRLIVFYKFNHIAQFVKFRKDI